MCCDKTVYVAILDHGPINLNLTVCSDIDTAYKQIRMWREGWYDKEYEWEEEKYKNLEYFIKPKSITDKPAFPNMRIEKKTLY